MSDALQVMAWRDCLRWAVNEPEVVQAFSRDTGTFVVARTGLDRMIDTATGRDKEIGERFIGWFNEHVWGEPEPAGARDA